jgi:hypothetical protein
MGPGGLPGSTTCIDPPVAGALHSNWRLPLLARLRWNLEEEAGGGAVQAVSAMGRRHWGDSLRLK